MFKIKVKSVMQITKGKLVQLTIILLLSVSTIQAAERATISGRIYSTIGRWAPMANAWVFAVDENGNVLGYTQSEGGRSKNSGDFTIRALPLNRKILLVGFTEGLKVDMATMEVFTGQSLIEVRNLASKPHLYVSTEFGFLENINSIRADNKADSLANYLLSQRR